MNGFWNVCGWRCACLLMLLTAGWAGADPDALHVSILQMARDGKNLDAIALYENLEDSSDVPADVLRAAAGCYWRERRFEESRALYRRILERQPNLRPIAGGDDKRPLPVPRDERTTAAVSGDRGAEETLAAAALRQELAVLKDAYRELESERERLRRDADARITALSVETEARVKEISAMRERLAAESGSTAAADEVRELREREIQLLEQVEQMRRAGEMESSRAVSLEQSLKGMRERFDEVSALLAVRDLEVERQLDIVEKGTLDLSLMEIERLEWEYAALEAGSTSRQAALQARIEALESAGASAAEKLAETEQAREKERQERLALEDRYVRQTEELNQARAMLEKATAALSRQYDAIREQVQDSVTIRVADGEGDALAEAESVPVSSDLAPLIGRLEEATASATVDVQQLRRQLEQERALFAEAMAEADRERTAQMDALVQRMDEMAAAATAREAEMVNVHAKAVEAMRVAHDLHVAGLNRELDEIRADLANRNRVLDMLESDLESEQESSARVLALARASEVTFGERIRELEVSFKQALRLATAAAAGETAVADNARLSDAGSILELLPDDPSGAIARFEALPPETEIPVEVLKAMGNLYREQRRYEPALRLFEQMLERVPGDLYAERKIVMTLFDMGLYDQALDRLAKPTGGRGKPGAAHSGR